MANFQHPLDPLSVDEVNFACDFVKKDVLPSKQFEVYSSNSVATEQSQAFVKFITVNLHDPSKDFVLQFKQGDSWDRQVKKCLLCCVRADNVLRL